MTPDTVRFYEKLKLLRPPERSTSGYRQCNDEALSRSSFIKRAKGLEFSLDEIRKLLWLDRKRNTRSSEMLDITNAKLAETRANLRDLSRIRSIRPRLTAECPGDMAPIEDYPILTFLRTPKSRLRIKSGS